MQWQPKALVAVVSLGVLAMASAQPVPRSSMTDVKPSDVGAAGAFVTPSSKPRNASECNAPPGGVLTRCLKQEQSASRVMADNGASTRKSPGAAHRADGGVGRGAATGTPVHGGIAAGAGGGARG
ncbi:MAG TPA: hypothetical protein VJ891_09015 [Casimicrobiaceae bacterium]|nr:hypothetical protein [Casimicrobiaceae bacterium]